MTKTSAGLIQTAAFTYTQEKIQEVTSSVAFDFVVQDYYAPPWLVQWDYDYDLLRSPEELFGI